ncbi:MAG TPA: PAS domain S-box protein [bacterium]
MDEQERTDSQGLRGRQEQGSEAATRTVAASVAPLLDVISDAALCLDDQGRIERLNAPVEALFGYPSHELVGRPVGRLLPALESCGNGGLRERSACLRETGGAITAHRADGSTLPVRVTEAQWGNGNGRVWVVRPIPDTPGSEERAAGGVVGGVADGVVGGVADDTRSDGTHARLTALLNLATDAIIGIDEQHRVVLFNRGAEEVFGYTPGEMLGQPLARLLPQRFRERHEEQMRAFACGERDSRAMNERRSVMALRRNGEEFAAEASITRILADGRVTMAVILRDVSARTKAVAELRANQRLLRTVFHALPLWITVKDREQRYIMTNRKVLEDIGIGEADLLGTNTLGLHYGTESDKIRVHQLDREILDGRSRFVTGEIPVHLPDGSLRTYQSIKVPLLDEGEQIAGVVNVSLDVTDRKQAEAALRASEERFRHLVQGFLEGIVIHRGFVPLFVNPAMAALFGYDSPEAIMQLGDLGVLVDPRARDAERQGPGLWEETSAIGAVGHQYTGLRRDGTPIRLEMFSHPIEWQGEQVMQSVLIDISQRERLEAQLRQAQKMEAVGQLAGGTAHDFNNLLQVVRGYSELASHDAGNPERVRKHLAQILRATEGGAHLVRQLLAFSRRDVLRPRTLNVNELVDEAIKMLRRVIPEHIELRFEPAQPPPQAYADGALLQQVLINLCVNARDAMPDGGRLTLRTAMGELEPERRARLGLNEPGPYVTIEVADTGTGITPEDLAHIFEPFFSTKEAGQGTGLGLAMAYGSVQQHNGMIDVETALGTGTTFRIHLPAGAGDAAQLAADAQLPVVGGNECVLVVEDSGMVLRVLCEALQQAGYRVLTARDGEEGLDVFLQHAEEVQLVVTDLVMPRMSGRDLYNRIRELEYEVPIVFSTGYSASVVDAHFMTRHARSILHKPYRPEELLRLVRIALERGAERGG